MSIRSQWLITYQNPKGSREVYAVAYTPDQIYHARERCGARHGSVTVKVIPGTSPTRPACGGP